MLTLNIAAGFQGLIMHSFCTVALLVATLFVSAEAAEKSSAVLNITLELSHVDRNRPSTVIGRRVA